MNVSVRSLHHQSGLTALGWLFAILLFGFTILCFAKVAPPYYDNWQIRNSLKTLGELRITENEFDGASDSQIQSHLSKFFRVNGIPTTMLKDVNITRDKGRAYVDLIWEIRVDFISNIDVVVSFENQFDSLNPTDCCFYRVDNPKNSD